MTVAKGLYVCDAGSIKVGVNGMSLLISNGIGDGRYSWEVTTDKPSWRDGWKFETCLQGKDIQIFGYDCNGGTPYPEKFTGAFMVYTKEGAIKFYKWSENPNHWGWDLR